MLVATLSVNASKHEAQPLAASMCLSVDAAGIQPVEGSFTVINKALFGSAGPASPSPDASGTNVSARVDGSGSGGGSGSGSGSGAGSGGGSGSGAGSGSGSGSGANPGRVVSGRAGRSIYERGR